jgi:hypothetical protein
MNIQELKYIIQKLENSHGNIDDVKILFRYNNNSDPIYCNYLEEDLYKKDNKTLDTVMFLNNNSETE